MIKLVVPMLRKTPRQRSEWFIPKGATLGDYMVIKDIPLAIEYDRKFRIVGVGIRDEKMEKIWGTSAIEAIKEFVDNITRELAMGKPGASK